MKKKWLACVLATALTFSSFAPVSAEEFSSGTENSEVSAPSQIPATTPDNSSDPFSDEAGSTENIGNSDEHTEDVNDRMDNSTDNASNDETSTAVDEFTDVTPEPEVVPVSPEDTDTQEPDTPAAEDVEDPFSSLSTEPVFSSSAKASVSASSVRLVCQGYAAGQVRVTAKISAPVKSQDKYYYLFQVNPSNNKLTKKVARITKPKGKNKSITFKLNTSGHPEYVLSKYAIAVKTKVPNKLASFKRISDGQYVKNPEKTAFHTAAYQLPATKKGLQTTSIDQITATGSKTIFFNLPVSVVLAQNTESVSYTYNGKKYNFNKIGGYTSLVQQCNQKGIQVTMQLLLDWTPATKDLIAAKAPGSKSAYYAWNTKTPASRQKMEALFSFLSQMFSHDNCYVSNWILGNEVNSCSRWNYAGKVSQSQYIQMYSEAFRSLYNAVRGQRASSKIFICLDQYWNNTWEDYSGKSILNSFNSCLKNMQPNVNWNLAYHAYPFPLTEPDFWSGRHADSLTNHSTSQVITLTNLSVLTNYIKKNYGSKTRVILSEQGFTSSQGEDVQAAALALGYYIAACNPMVDGFMIRSYQDESHEVAQGLSMGIKGKKAFRVFQNMDTANSLRYTRTYLNRQVGSDWTRHVPYYQESRLSKLYRK